MSAITLSDDHNVLLIDNWHRKQIRFWISKIGEIFSFFIVVVHLKIFVFSTVKFVDGAWIRIRSHGIPIRCTCGEGVIELISKSGQNPYRRYYQCLYAAQRKLVNGNHIFKWVDEAFTDEVLQLSNQVCVLEEELQLLKMTMRTE
ncbi:hypothetical protein N665_0069s0014 [Sinapis alba]|nr:hypothetical protein N665_0069s0014 [Sinapis alba]